MKSPPGINQLLSGLPGEEMILSGLRDLEAGRFTTCDALLVLIARSRLTRAGLTFLESLELEPDPGQRHTSESMLYKALQKSSPASAYALYNSLKRRLDSFIRCLELRQETVGIPGGEADGDDGH